MSFFYLATPYTDFPEGHEEACRLAAVNAAILLRHGVPIFCPITHSHPIASTGLLDGSDHDLWMGIDRPFLELAAGLIVVCLTGWDASKGIRHEVDYFLKKNLSIVYMQHGIVPNCFYP